MKERLYAISTEFDVPKNCGGGKFLVGIVRTQGAFTGQVTFMEHKKHGERRMFVALVDDNSSPASDERLIRQAIAQALSENRFSQAAQARARISFELNVMTNPYPADLRFFR